MWARTTSRRVYLKMLRSPWHILPPTNGLNFPSRPLELIARIVQYDVEIIVSFAAQASALSRWEFHSRSVLVDISLQNLWATKMTAHFNKSPWNARDPGYEQQPMRIGWDSIHSEWNSHWIHSHSSRHSHFTKKCNRQIEQQRPSRS